MNILKNFFIFILKHNLAVCKQILYNG